MKQCTRCSNMLAADAHYCYVCSTTQTTGFDEFELKQKPNATFLIILCILTILGSVFTFISLPFNTAASIQLGIEYPVWVLIGSGVVAAGKLLGAIFMLLKKMTGLYIYTAAAVGNIIISIYSSLAVNIPTVSDAFTYIGLAFGLLFAILFIVLYWLPVNRRVLS